MPAVKVPHVLVLLQVLTAAPRSLLKWWRMQLHMLLMLVLLWCLAAADGSEQLACAPRWDGGSRSVGLVGGCRAYVASVPNNPPSL